ncbi:hypothetical protein BANRA_05452 [Escherichia coli]|uniref:Uncharacterized protein n=1 Tax=Escherichia coli TaxID=562 RepID=A0A3P5HDQ8_ECOLX|nr:hypothetical protein BANRA_05452 [Escherichia coli]
MPDNSFSTYFSASRFFSAAIIQKLKQEIADDRQCEHHIEKDLIQPGFHDDAVNKHCDRRDNKSGKIKYVQNLPERFVPAEIFSVAKERHYGLRRVIHLTDVPPLFAKSLSCFFRAVSKICSFPDDVIRGSPPSVHYAGCQVPGSRTFPGLRQPSCAEPRCVH